MNRISGAEYTLMGLLFRRKVPCGHRGRDLGHIGRDLGVSCSSRGGAARSRLREIDFWTGLGGGEAGAPRAPDQGAQAQPR